ncbi:MAG: hypothetical protein IJ693_01375 [Bacteroidaceae bacterium]|nr:hypothetical protein [Bacteroidaceae bacterium]
MKRFLQKIGWFILPCVTLLVLAEVYIEHMPNIARDKHQWMLQHAHEVKTLVLGDSHTFYGVRPDLLGEGAFSLALQSQTYRYNYYLLKHYPMKKLQTVIIPFCYFSLWEDFENQSGEEFQAMRYRIYMDCDIHPRYSWYGFEVMSMPVVREKLKSLYTPNHNQWDSLGWGTEYTKDARAEDWDNGKIRAEGNTYHDTTLVALNKAFLEDIFNYCRQHHIKVLLLNTPVSHTFREYEEKRQIATNNKVLKELLNRHPEVEYLDFEADPRFGDDDFYDADHLNTEGATKLTTILKDYL